MNVPALRFPEFEGAWESTVLGQTANFRRGSFPQPYGLPEWYDDKNGHPFVQVFDVAGNFKLKPKTKRRISDLAAKQSVFVPKNSIILTIQGSIGRIAITQYDAYVDRTLLIFRSFNVPVDKSFFALAIFLLFEKEKRMAPGGTIKTITKEVLSSFKFNNPTLPEQKKIAAFLGVVDAKLAALGHVRAGLQTYKRGLMQKLFAQELRFTNPDGSAFPDWEEKRLGDFCEALSGHPVAGHEIIETKNDTPLLRGINITEGVIRHSAEIDRFHGGDLNNLDRFLVHEGDVVIAMDGSKVGKNVATVTKRDAGSFLIQRVTRLRPKGRNDTRLVYQKVTSISFRNYVDVVNTSSGIPHISLKQIRDFPIPMPHPDEQRLIADALQAMDAKISAVSDQITQMEAFKKGLLQQMFV